MSALMTATAVVPARFTGARYADHVTTAHQFPAWSSPAAKVPTMAEDSDPDVAIQALLTVNLQKLPDARQIIGAVVARSSARGVKEIGAPILTAPGIQQVRSMRSADRSWQLIPSLAGSP